MPVAPLNPRFLEFVRHYTARKAKTFGNAYKAALAAGYSDSYARKITAVMSDEVRDTMADALDAVGVDQKRIARAHSDLIGASELDRLTFAKKLSDEEIKELVESVPGCRLVYVREEDTIKVAYVQLADHRAREKGLDLAYKVRGDYAPEKHEHSVTTLEDILDEPPEAS